MAGKLTAKVVEQIGSDRSGKRREIPDGLIAGLYLVVQTTGAKSWAVRYRHNGRPRKHTLGAYPKIGLASARDAASDLLVEVAKGADPAGEKQQKRATARRDEDGNVVDDHLWEVVVADFLELYARPRLRSAKEIKRCLERETLPAWRGRRIEEIGKRDVIALIDKIASRGSPVAARRTFALVRKLFNWAIGRALIETHPCHRIELPGAEAKRDRILDDAEIELLWRAADKMGWPFGPLVQLLVLTGQRISEVGEMEWREIDVKELIWTIPKARAKNGLEHIVPLSDEALTLLSGLPRIGDPARYVFTTNGTSPVSGYSKAKRRLDQLMVKLSEVEEGDDQDDEKGQPWVFHDIRRTVASGMRRIGQPLDVVEKVLNHVGSSFSGIRGVYQRYDYLDEKAVALKDWAAFIAQLAIEDRLSNVSPIQGRNLIA